MSDDARETDADLRAVYDAVAEAPDADHAPGTTLAPAHDALTGPTPAAEAASRLERYLPLATSVADVATGPGRLLERVDSFPTLVGLEDRPGLLALARERGPVARAAPTALPLAGVDAVSAFGHATAPLDEPDFERFLREVHGALAPGGTLLFDALLDPGGVPADAATVTDGTVKVRRERRVEPGAAGDDAVVLQERYELTDLALEESLTVERAERLRTTDPGRLWSAVDEAGFADVMLTTRAVDDGAALVVADREGQLSPDAL
jgi:SAM-dependent methyltransferase